MTPAWTFAVATRLATSMKKLISLVSMALLAVAVTAMAQEGTKAEKKAPVAKSAAAKAPTLSWATGTVATAAADSVTLNNVKPVGKAKMAAGAGADNTLVLKADDKTKVSAGGAMKAADLKAGEEVKVSYHADFPEKGTNHAMSIASPTAAKAKTKKPAKKPA